MHSSHNIIVHCDSVHCVGHKGGTVQSFAVTDGQHEVLACREWEFSCQFNAVGRLYCSLAYVLSFYIVLHWLLLPPTKEEVNAFFCLSVCLLARLLKNACMDLDEMLHADRCCDMDELINF